MPLDESGVLRVSQTSYDHVRAYWDEIGTTVVGRHVFDVTDGWDGVPPAGVDHVVVVTHRPAPEGWDPAAPFHFVDGIDAAVAVAKELAGDRIVEVAAGDVGGQALAAGLVDEVRMDVAPVVFGTGRRYFGSVAALRRASAAEIQEVQGIGPALAEAIRVHLASEAVPAKELAMAGAGSDSDASATPPSD